MEDDNVIFEKIKQGDQRAFKLLFNTYYKKIKSFTNVLIFDKGFVEEIVQDVFVELWERRESLVIHTSIKNYLYTSAKNKAFNWNRKKANNHEELKEENNLIADVSLGPIDAMENEEILKKFEEAVKNLPPQAKLVYELKYVKGLKQKEISAQLKISENTVEKHTSYVRKFLKNIFPKGFQYHN